MDKENFTQATYLSALEAVKDRTIFCEIPSEEDIRQAEQLLGRQLPMVLKNFFLATGGISTRSEFNIFGIIGNEYLSPFIKVNRWVRQSDAAFPPDAWVVGSIDWKVLAYLEPSSGCVLPWRTDLPASQQNGTKLANTFEEFVVQVIKELVIIEQALENLEVHVLDSDEKYHYTNSGGGKLPRNQDWRVHRFCSRDIILGVLAIKHQMGVNCLLVDLFLPIDLPPFEPGGSLIFMTLFILGDAYRCGGSMEIRFTRKVDGGQIPRKLQALAAKVGAPIKPESLAENRLDPDDSLRLYVALTGFSRIVLEHIQKHSINLIKACYVIHRGIWTKPEVEMLLLLSRRPEIIFSGGPSPADWQTWFGEQRIGRSAILGNYLTRALARRTPIESGEDTEDDNNEVSVSVLPEIHALQYRVSPPLEHIRSGVPIPWLLSGTSDLDTLTAEREILVLPRARDRFEIRSWLEGDLNRAAEASNQLGLPAYLLLPRDFLDIHLDAVRSTWVELAARHRVGLIICGEDCAMLDEEVTRRWRVSRVVRD